MTVVTGAGTKSELAGCTRRGCRSRGVKCLHRRMARAAYAAQNCRRQIEREPGQVIPSLVQSREHRLSLLSQFLSNRE